MRLKRIKEYLGTADDLLDTMQTDRCSGSGVGANGGAPSQVIAGATNVNATEAASAVAVERVSDTSYIVAYRQSTSPNFLKAFIVTIDPTDMSVTFGATVTLNAITAANYKVKFLEAGRILVFYAGSGAIYGKVLTISGDAITAGAEQTLVASGTTGLSGGVALSANKFLLIYNPTVGKSQALVLNRSGDVVTPAALAYDISPTTTAAELAQFSPEKVDTNRIIIAYGDNTGNKARILTISGDVVTPETAVSLASVPASATEYYHLKLISPSLVAVLSYGSDTTQYGVISVSGAVLTLDPVSVFAGGSTSLNTSSIGLSALNTDRVASIATESGIDRRPYVEVVKMRTSTTLLHKASTALTTEKVNLAQSVKVSDTIAAYAGISSYGGGQVIAQAVKIT